MEPSLDVAVRLADEGVPIAAIARAVKVSSSDLREQLTHAQQDGRLLELPRDDWPPGFPRDQRALQLSRLAIENRGALQVAVQETFGLTPSQARILLLLIQNSALCREVIDLNSLSVQVYFMRQKLQAFGLEVLSIRGYGYQLSSADQQKPWILFWPTWRRRADNQAAACTGASVTIWNTLSAA
jgi:hypothetical protein